MPAFTPHPNQPQAAARTYWRAVEPIVARAAPDQVPAVNALLGAASPLKSYKPLIKAYKAVAAAMGMVSWLDPL